MKQEILERIDSVVAGYVNQYASDWTEIDRRFVEKSEDSMPFLVMMRPSGVDVAFLEGEYSTMENAFHSQAALPHHELFLYYDGERLKSITRSAAEKLCGQAVSRYEYRDLPMDGFLKAVERYSDDAGRNDNANSAYGECGPWRVSLLDRQYSTGMGLEICYSAKPVARAFKTINTAGVCELEFGRYHNTISDKTFNEIFDVLRSVFADLTRDFNERIRFQAAKQELSK